MPNQERQIGEAGNSVLSVWDSEYCPPSEAFSFFREVICGTFMPWSPEFDSEREFEGRIKGIVFEDKSIGHVSISPLAAVRTDAHVANSEIDGSYANFVLSGELHVEQGGRSTLAKRGDLVVYNTARPVKMASQSPSRYEDISILIPKRCFSHVKDAEDQFNNILLTRDRLINPLFSTLSFLAENMQSLSKAELMSLYDSCVSLLPLAADSSDDPRFGKSDTLQSDLLWKDILEFVNRNISEPELSPAFTAQKFSLSVRYIHKLFAGNGTTFSAYVVAKRLDSIRDDLLSPTSRNQPISNLAYRWGFKDLSTFNRAFKKRFSCSPKSFREGYWS